MIAKDPVILVAIPLLLAFSIPILYAFWKNAIRYIPLLAALLNVLAVVPLFKNSAKFISVYSIGGWNTKFGISLLFNQQIGMILLAVNIVAFLALVYFFYNEHDLGNGIAYSLAYTLALTGVNGLILTGDIFNMYVFMELTAIAGFIIAAHKKGYFASFNFVVLSSVGSIMFLMGTVALYNVTGSLSLANMGTLLVGLPTKFTLIIGIIFVIAMSAEAELLPLNGWVPKVYKDASGTGSVFFASILSTASLYAIIKLMITVFRKNYADVNTMLLVFGLVTLFVGEASAFKQKNVKKMIAFSSIAQAGLIISAVAIAISGGHLNNAIFSAAIFQLFNNIFAKALILLGISMLGYFTLDSIKGIAKKRMYLVVLITVGVLSMVGMPGFAGFWSKIYLIKSLILSGYGWFVFIFLTSALFEVYYYLRFAQTMFFEEYEEKEHKENNFISYTVLTVLAVIIILIGFMPNSITGALSGIILGGM